MISKTIFCILVSLALASCESAGSGASVPIPNLVVDCDATKCSAVASGSYDMVANITLSGCDADQIEAIPVVSSAVTVSCVNGVGCSGTVSSWRDTNGDAETEISSRTYSVCGWIDLDRSGVIKNSNDAFAEANELVTSSTITLSDWGAANFSRRKISPSH